jgi:hypothetical protein
MRPFPSSKFLCTTGNLLHRNSALTISAGPPRATQAPFTYVNATTFRFRYVELIAELRVAASIQKTLAVPARFLLVLSGGYAQYSDP